MIRRPSLILLALVAVFTGVWILGMPASSGPDEPGHQIRGAALVRGQLDGQTGDFGAASRAYELPAHVGFPDPGCYAFDPLRPAACIAGLEPESGDQLRPTRSNDYPIWGHLLPGLGSFAPAGASGWLARAFDALIPIVLVTASLVVAARRGRLPFAATLLAITPAAWFSFAIVNPSGVVIAGGIGLWTALLVPTERRRGSRDSAATRDGLPSTTRRAPVTWLTRLERWLLAVSWTAMVLPRRDGLVYAALVLSIGLIAAEHEPRQLWTSMRRGPQVLVVGSTLATLAWASRSTVTSTQLLFLAPLAPVAAVLVRGVWRRLGSTARPRPARAAYVAGLVVVAGIGSVVAMSLRGDGFDRAVLRATVSQTGLDLREVVGVLGWLDTPVPETFVSLWFVGVGLVAGAALTTGWTQRAVAAGTTAAIGILVSWTLTMLQNDDTGLYWQGRYYLPLMAGVPILLGAAVRRRRRRSTSSPPNRSTDPVAIVVSTIAVAVSVVALAAAMRRFGVGTSGSYLPTDWDTYDSPVPPVVLLVVGLVAALGIAEWGRRFAFVEGRAPGPVDRPERRSTDAPRGGFDPSTGVNVVGYHDATSGLGHIAREVSASLSAAGVPVRAVSVDAPESPRRSSGAGDSAGPSSTSSGDDDAPLYDTTIAVITAAQLPGVLDARPEVADLDGPLVGYWFWELEDVPDEHRWAIDLVDEIWTPTRFVHDAYSSAVESTRTVVPVRHLPTRIAEPVAEQRSAMAAAWRSSLCSTPDTVLFVVSFDLLSDIERKNPLGAIEAFHRAFGDPAEGTAAVKLLVKTLNGGRRPDDLARIERAAAPDDRIEVLDRHVSDDGLVALIAAADAYVSLHRGEGLGLHLATAMWVGTPVIATDWSGTGDIVDADSAELVGYRLVAVGDRSPAYPPSAHWADPDVDAAASAMRRLALDPDARRRRAQAGRARINAQDSRAEVGRRMVEALGLDV
ncbi:MAG: DUF2142 domain-containing protein [Actinomycetota bacterium]